MKKLIAIAIATLSLSAYAQKSMVTLSGFEQDDHAARSLNLEFGHDKSESTQNFAVNYAYAVTDAVQVGLNYGQNITKTHGDIAFAGDKTKKMGLQAIYNFANKLTDTSYAAVHYDTVKSYESEANDDEAKTNTWGFEYGHRFSLGNLMGLNVNYSPSATLAFNKVTSDLDADDDTSATNFTLNFVKFDVLF